MRPHTAAQSKTMGAARAAQEPAHTHRLRRRTEQPGDSQGDAGVVGYEHKASARHAPVHTPRTLASCPLSRTRTPGDSTPLYACTRRAIGQAAPHPRSWGSPHSARLRTQLSGEPRRIHTVTRAASVVSCRPFLCTMTQTLVTEATEPAIGTLTAWCTSATIHAGQRHHAAKVNTPASACHKHARLDGACED